MNSKKEVQHVYIVGAKSLGAYGGYETFVYKLTEYHQNKENIKYHVACKANGDGCMDESKFDGVTKINEHEFELHNAHCFKIDVPQIGPAQAIYYDVAALKACCEHPLGYGNLRRVQPALRHLIDFITVQHQVGCESVMLVKKDVLVLNGQKLVQGKHRVQFQQMIEDAKAKKIDLILTKSISRFARNVVDCLTNIRLLRNLRPPVSVYFDKERLDSLDEKAEVFLTMLASFAQEESRSISTNIKWATRSRMKAGTQKISTTSLLGYDTDDDGEMVIVTNEAEIVRTIYMSFDKGMHPAEIAEKLNALEIRTIKNNPWTGESVKNILRNEKYCGDVLMQKTYTVDCLTHKTKKNEGEVEQYFIPDHHPAIVEREIWDKAQVRLEQIAGKRRRIRPKQQRLVPLRKGVLLFTFR